jgi:CrcB protein
MLQFFLVAFGGAVGSVLRYYVGLSTLRIGGPNFPWGTLTVNIVGCFLIGVLAELITLKYGEAVPLRLLLITGFLGGFTTFSAFSLDTIVLIENGNLPGAIVYVVASVGVSLVAVLAGLALVRSFA